MWLDCSTTGLKKIQEFLKFEMATEKIKTKNCIWLGIHLIVLFY